MSKAIINDKMNPANQLVKHSKTDGLTTEDLQYIAERKQVGITVLMPTSDIVKADTKSNTFNTRKPTVKSNGCGYNNGYSTERATSLNNGALSGFEHTLCSGGARGLTADMINIIIDACDDEINNTIIAQYGYYEQVLLTCKLICNSYTKICVSVTDTTDSDGFIIKMDTEDTTLPQTKQEAEIYELLTELKQLKYISLIYNYLPHTKNGYTSKQAGGRQFKTIYNGVIFAERCTDVETGVAYSDEIENITNDVSKFHNIGICRRGVICFDYALLTWHYEKLYNDYKARQQAIKQQELYQ